MAGSATDPGKRFERLNDRLRRDMWQASDARAIGNYTVLHGSIPILLLVGCYNMEIADLTGQKGPTLDARKRGNWQRIDGKNAGYNLGTKNQATN